MRSPSCTQIDEKKARVLFAREREREREDHRATKSNPAKTVWGEKAMTRDDDDDDYYYYFTYCVRVVGAFGSIENGRPAFIKVVVSLLR